MKPVERSAGPAKTGWRRARIARSGVQGLTIIELMTVLIVLGVLIAVVSPAISGIVARQRVQGVHAEILGDLQLARSEQARRSGTNTSVSVSFGSNADLTCYVIHVVATGVVCDCTRAPGSVCLPAALPEREIKTVQLARTAGVSVAASSASGPRVTFVPPQGLAPPGDLVIDVQSATRGQLRTSVSGLGVPSVCSPDGSIPGVPSC